jgi:hypothetical protein
MPVNDMSFGPYATTPDNPLQNVKLGTLTELAKDAFVLELRHFFDNQITNLYRKDQVPLIQKYAIPTSGPQGTNDPFETSIQLFRQYPDLTQKLPFIAVLGSTGQTLKMGLSTRFVDQIQVPGILTATKSEPYTINTYNYLNPTNFNNPTIPPADYLEIATYPSGFSLGQTINKVYFQPQFFVNPAQAKASEVATAMGFQIAPYGPAGFKAGTDGGSPAKLTLCPTIFKTPNSIQVVGGSTNALAQFGFQTNAQVANSIGRRYMNAGTITISLQVGAQGDNIRTEVTDLLDMFLNLEQDDKNYEFIGRTLTNSGIPDETWQVIIQDANMAFAGETEIPRPDDPNKKIFLNRINVPVHVIQYFDRIGTPLSFANLIDPPGIAR